MGIPPVVLILLGCSISEESLGGRIRGIFGDVRSCRASEHRVFTSVAVVKHTYEPVVPAVNKAMIALDL